MMDTGQAAHFTSYTPHLYMTIPDYHDLQQQGRIKIKGQNQIDKGVIFYFYLQLEL